MGSIVHGETKLKEPARDLKIVCAGGKTTSSHPVAFLPDLLGITFDGLPPPPLEYPATRSELNMIAGLRSRVARLMLDRDQAMTDTFEDFFTLLLPRIFTDLPTNSDLKELDETLEDTNYTTKRKEAIRNARKRYYKETPMKTFIKAEGLEANKAPRLINGPELDVTALLLPIFHVIDKFTFKTKYFVKGSDPRTWPKRQKDLFGTNPVLETDFSGFEAHHSGVYAKCLYKWVIHMTHNLSGIRNHLALLKKMMLGINRLKARKVWAKLEQRMMSGVLWTSSGNGVLNLAFMMFLAYYDPNVSVAQIVDRAVTEFRGLVEGDDGICLDTQNPNRKDAIEGLGIDLDLVEHSHFGKAGFCGVICDPESLTVVRNPVKVLRDFFVLPIKYQHSSSSTIKALLRAKALSGKYIAGNCPVIGSLYDWVLAETRSIDVRGCSSYLDTYHRGQCLDAIKTKVWQEKSTPSDTAYQMVEDNYGVSVIQQKDMEQRFKGKFPDLPCMNLFSYSQIKYGIMHYVVDPRDFGYTRDPPAEILQCWNEGYNTDLTNMEIFSQFALQNEEMNYLDFGVPPPLS